MNPKHVINIAANTCPPQTDAAFNQWYDTDHIPIVMSFKELLGITRYRIVRAYDAARATEYPGYLTTYRFSGMDTFRVWNSSPQLEEGGKNWQQACGNRGVKLFWRAQYESIQTWQRTLPHSAIIMVGAQCPPESDARFDTWYSGKHIPELLKFRGLQGVTRYRFADASDPNTKQPVDTPVAEYPRHLTFYHFDNTFNFGHTSAADAFDESQEYLAARVDFDNIARETGAYLLWRAQYEPIKTWLR